MRNTSDTPANNIGKSLKWSAIERLAVQAIQLVTMIFLARTLGPQAYGLIGMLAIFLAMFQIFIDSGFSAALIRKVDRTEVDVSTTFYFNLLVSCACYLIFYISAPYIALFFEQPQLVAIARVSGLVLIANSLVLVPKTLLTIEMDFKTLAKSSILSVVISSIVSVILALLDYGVWVLVIQSISMAILDVVFLGLFCPWRPKTGFSNDSFNDLFGFGSKLLLSSFIDTVYGNIYQLLIGKMFSASDLGLFTQAKNLSSLPAITFSTIVQRVTYPYLSHVQNDNAKLEIEYSKIIELSAFVVFPVFSLVSLLSEDVIKIVLGEAWSDASSMFSILCLCFMLYPIQSLNLNLLKVKGRSDLFLRLEIIKKIILTIILFITVPRGLLAICLGMLIHSLLSLVINTYYSGKITNLGILKQFKLFIPILICCLIALSVISVVTRSINISWMVVLVSLPIMFFSYLVSARFLCREILVTLFSGN